MGVGFRLGYSGRDGQGGGVGGCLEVAVGGV